MRYMGMGICARVISRECGREFRPLYRGRAGEGMARALLPFDPAARVRLRLGRTWLSLKLGNV